MTQAKSLQSKPGNAPTTKRNQNNAEVTLEEITMALEDGGDPARAESALRFFKTGPGQYGEGDLFRGLTVPVLRKLESSYRAAPLGVLFKLLESKFHEDRLLSLLILVRQFKTGDAAVQKAIHTHYLKNTRFINNWDLVDSSAADIVGGYLADRSRRLLERLACSSSLWDRRIAIIATFYFIRRNEFDDTFRIAELLMSDREDLIHKAVGWMLREAGKRSTTAEMKFLDNHCAVMPRTMLRYAIERFPAKDRERYMGARRLLEQSTSAVKNSTKPQASKMRPSGL